MKIDLQIIIPTFCGLCMLSACGNPEPEQRTTELADTSSPAIESNAVSDPTPNDTVQIETEVAPASDAVEVRQADSHTHGDANLAIVLEGNSLTVELETPLFNLTGFEHAPETDEQTDAVEAAEATLGAPEALFITNEEAQCAAQDTDADIHLIDGLDDEHSEHDEGEDHHEGDEHDEHDGDHHDEHSDEHADAHDEELHQDVLLTYTFQCSTPEKLSEIDIDLLKAFPNMTDLDVAYLGPETQRLFELDQTTTKVTLR